MFLCPYTWLAPSHDRRYVYGNYVSSIPMQMTILTIADTKSRFHPLQRFIPRYAVIHGRGKVTLFPHWFPERRERKLSMTAHEIYVGIVGTTTIAHVNNTRSMQAAFWRAVRKILMATLALAFHLRTITGKRSWEFVEKLHPNGGRCCVKLTHEASNTRLLYPH